MAVHKDEFDTVGLICSLQCLSFLFLLFPSLDSQLYLDEAYNASPLSNSKTANFYRPPSSIG